MEISVRYKYCHLFFIVLFLTMTIKGSFKASEKSEKFDPVAIFQEDSSGMQYPIRLLRYAVPENKHRLIKDIKIDLESNLKAIEQQIRARVWLFSYHAKNTTVNSSFEELGYNFIYNRGKGDTFNEEEMKAWHALYLESPELALLKNEKLTLEIAEKICFSVYWKQNLLAAPLLINRMVMGEKPILFSLVQSKLLLNLSVKRCENDYDQEDLLRMIGEDCKYYVPTFCPCSLEVFGLTRCKKMMIEETKMQAKEELERGPALVEIVEKQQMEKRAQKTLDLTIKVEDEKKS